MFSGASSGGQSAFPAQAPLTTPTITNRPGTLRPGSTGRDPFGRDDLREGAAPPMDPRDPRFIPEPVETNEYQEFIAASTGRVLPIFGHNLFRGVPSTFAPVDNVPVTPDYAIGPGDELYIRGWGQIDIDYQTTVDRNGQIAIPKVGVLNVAGIKYADLSEFVKTAVARVFRNFELTVTMGRLRSIQIFVVGQARRPGSYTVSSLSTLVNAVFAAGGPSARGSLRTIQLKRGGQVVTEMDLYDLLVYGDKSKDAQLLPGDVIYIAPVGPLVAITGSVNTPAVFELKGDTPIGKLVEWSGGLASTAQTRVATIERIEARRVRQVDQLSLDATGLARPLQDGDLVTVLPISPRFENAVTLRGNVAVPLRYPHKPGMRIRDLIPDREALITYDYYLKRNLAITRLGGRDDRHDGVRDDRRDAGRDDRRDAGRDDRRDASRDERRDAGRDDRRDGTKGEQLLRTEVKNLLSEINWDYAVVERLDRADLSSRLLPFNLGKAVLEGEPQHNLELEPGDVVTVFSKTDISVPMARRTRLVRVEGEIANAGVYQALPGETLRQIVARVGGLSPHAYLYGTEFTRESTREQQQKNYEETLNRIERETELQAAERARNVLSAEDAAALNTQAAAQKAQIARLRQLKPQGRIVLELTESAKVEDLPDLELEDGDRIAVPARPGMVSVFGAVFTESSFLYRSGRSLSDYLDLAGGPTNRADRSQIFVLRAGGTVESAGRSWLGYANSKILPGDAIVVPEDYDRTSFVKNLKDWTQILYQFGIGVAALQVLRQ